MRLAGLFQPRQIGLQSCALSHQGRNFLCEVSVVAPAIPSRRRTFSLCTVVCLKRGAIGFNLLLNFRQPPGELALRLDARFAGIAVKKRAVDRHNLTAQQIELAQHKHKLPVRRLERLPVLLPERGNGAIARHQPLHQPDQLEIAAGFTLESARRPHPIGVAI